MVVSALVDSFDGEPAYWWQLGLDANNLVDRDCSDPGADLDGLFLAGIPAVNDAEWSARDCIGARSP